MHDKILGMKRLRVVQVVTKLELGGAQLSTLYAASNLNPSLFEVHLIAGPGGLLDDEALQLKNVNVKFCSDLSKEVRPIADFQAFQQLQQILKTIQPDIVHTHTYKAGILGRLAASSVNVPTVIHTYHGFGFHRFQGPGMFKLFVALEREACRRSHHLIFISRENWKWAEQLELIQKCTASLIRSGIELEPLLETKRSAAFRKNLGVLPKDKAVGMIASLKLQKDPLTFVQIADLVTPKNRSAKFLLFGDGDLAELVLRQVPKMRYPRNFHHFGWRRDVPEILANLDLLVVTSIWEGLPRIIPEATVKGVPVVATDIDGNREAVFEGKNGILAQPRDPEDFARKVLKALEDNWRVDPDLSRQIQHEYDIREMIRSLEELYLNLASGIVSRVS
jgi:glycosyltransferase involved in cell wall biosynthesis